MGMDGRERRGLPNAQKAHMRRTGTTHAKVGTAVQTRSRRVKLCDRCNPESKGRTWTLAPSGLLLHDTLRNTLQWHHIRSSYTQIIPTYYIGKNLARLAEE